MESPQNLKKENNFAYIDGANLDKGIAADGWKVDFGKFKTTLKEVEHQYNVN